MGGIFPFEEVVNLDFGGIVGVERQVVKFGRFWVGYRVKSSSFAFSFGVVGSLDGRFIEFEGFNLFSVVGRDVVHPC